MAPSQVVSPLLEEIRALYGEAFDQALQRNVTDALAEDIGKTMARDAVVTL